MITYKLIRIEENQPEREVELSVGELDTIWLALEDYSDCVMDESSGYYNAEFEAEYSGLMMKLGDI